MMELKEEFFNRTRITPNCWIWIGSLDKDKYGCIGKNRKVFKAHRLSWLIHNGEIPSGLCVCHRCDNPSCVNPGHLFIGTQKENVADCVLKGRHRNPVYKADKHPRAKLDWNKVVEIRDCKNTSQMELSKKYGVSKSLIGLIKRNIIWKEG